MKECEHINILFFFLNVAISTFTNQLLKNEEAKAMTGLIRVYCVEVGALGKSRHLCMTTIWCTNKD